MELAFLRRALRRLLPDFRLPLGEDLKMAGLAIAAILPGGTTWWLLPRLPPLLTAACVVGVYAMSYLALAHVAGLEEMAGFTRALRRKLGR